MGIVGAYTTPLKLSGRSFFLNALFIDCSNGVKPVLDITADYKVIMKKTSFLNCISSESSIFVIKSKIFAGSSLSAQNIVGSLCTINASITTIDTLSLANAATESTSKTFPGVISTTGANQTVSSLNITQSKFLFRDHSVIESIHCLKYTMTHYLLNECSDCYIYGIKPKEKCDYSLSNGIMMNYSYYYSVFWFSDDAKYPSFDFQNCYFCNDKTSFTKFFYNDPQNCLFINCYQFQMNEGYPSSIAISEFSLPIVISPRIYSPTNSFTINADGDSIPHYGLFISGYLILPFFASLEEVVKFSRDMHSKKWGL